MILSFQLIITSVFVYFGCVSKGYKTWMIHNIWCLYLLLVVSLVSLYALVYVRSLARTVPVNFILLTIFTLAEGYLVSATTIQYDPQTVLNAALLTMSIVVALTVYAFKTETDFTLYGGILYVVLSSVVMASLLSFFFPSSLFRTIISVVSVILFSFYLIYDTQLILGKGELRLTVDDYIFAAMNLYLDIINLFLSILQIFGNSN